MSKPVKLTECQKNICSCKNGKPLEICNDQQGDSCHSCNIGYFLNTKIHNLQNVEIECVATCPKGKHIVEKICKNNICMNQITKFYSKNRILL